MLYTRQVKEPGCLFDIRARLHTLDMPVSKDSLVPLKLSLWSDYSKSVLVQDEIALLCVAAQLCKVPINGFVMNRTQSIDILLFIYDLILMK